MKNIVTFYFILISIVLSSLTFEFEEISKFAVSGDYGEFQRLEVDDNYLYAISHLGFDINIINENGSLNRLSFITLEGDVDSMVKIGNNIFVSVSTASSYQNEVNSALYKIDISNPYEPCIIDSIIFSDNLKNSILGNSGSYLTYHKLERLNNNFFFTELVFMNPITFEEITSFVIHTFTDHLKNNYFMQQRNAGEYIFDVYDYSDIYNIELVNSIDFSSCPTNFMLGYSIDDNTFALMGNESVSFYDISDILNINYISTYDRFCNYVSPFGDCTKIDNFLLIPSQEEGIEVVNITNLENPTFFHFWEYPYTDISSINPYFSTSGNIHYDDGNLYVGTFYNGILQMSFNNGVIEYINKNSNNRINSVFHQVYENYLFSTGYSGGLYIYNLENITQPILETIILDNLFIETFKIIDNYMYLITYSLSENEFSFLVFDIVDISNPILHLDQELAEISYFLINENEPNCLYVCTILSSDYVTVNKYNIEIPEEIEQILFFEYQGLIEPSFFHNGFLYVEEYDDDSMNNLLIYHGFEDEEPILMNQILNFIGTAKICKVDDFLQFSNFSFVNGDDFYNLNDPLNPEYAFSTQNSSKLLGSVIKDNVLFSPSEFTVYLYNLEESPSGLLEPFDHFNLNSRYRNINFYNQNEEDFFFCEQLECISTYHYSIETSAEDELPSTEISLSNYPNPFNPETNIVFNLQENSEVQIDIFNIKGQKIRSLLNDQIIAGEHSIVWDGKDYSGKEVGTGLYFYKLKVNNVEIVKKCILMK